LLCGLLEGRVGGVSRAVRVLADSPAQAFAAPADDVRQVTAGVEARVPGTAAFERAQIARAVAAQLLDFREQLGLGAAAVEERDGMAARERGGDERTAGETRAAENEETHGILPGPRSVEATLSGTCT